MATPDKSNKQEEMKQSEAKPAETPKEDKSDTKQQSKKAEQGDTKTKQEVNEQDKSEKESISAKDERYINFFVI